ADAPHAGAAWPLPSALLGAPGGLLARYGVGTPGDGLAQEALEDLRVEGGVGEVDPVQVVGAGVGFVLPALPPAVLERISPALDRLDHPVADDHDLVGPERGENLRAAGREDFRLGEVVPRKLLLEGGPDFFAGPNGDGHGGPVREPAEELDG